jgi:hypothetical protein
LISDHAALARSAQASDAISVTNAPVARASWTVLRSASTASRATRHDGSALSRTRAAICAGVSAGGRAPMINGMESLQAQGSSPDVRQSCARTGNWSMAEHARESASTLMLKKQHMPG